MNHVSLSPRARGGARPRRVALGLFAIFAVSALVLGGAGVPAAAGLDAPTPVATRPILDAAAWAEMGAATSPEVEKATTFAQLAFDQGDRFVPRPAGTERTFSFVFGPMLIPGGHDLNRVQADIPVVNGFVTDIKARAIDPRTMDQYSNMDVHIHHLLWYHLAGEEDDVDLIPLGAFLFATGEERTHFDLEPISDAKPGGPRHGIYVKGDEGHALVFMLHNKQAASALVYMVMDVTFVDGTAAAIRAAPSCLVLLPGESCRAGQEFRELKNRLWGSIYDVNRGSGTHRRDAAITMSHSGTVVFMASHLHPEGLEIIFTNTGYNGGCRADIDGDGYPGVTIFRGDRVERDPAANGHSEDFQMETTQPAWRAHVLKGDRITAHAIYRNNIAPAYDAMNIATIHVDRAEAPPLRKPGCDYNAMKAFLVGGATGNPVDGVLSREWDTPELPHCGAAWGNECEPASLPRYQQGELAEYVHIAGFAYVPGDRALLGTPAGGIPQVKKGESLTFVNDDSAGIIRHTVTSCKWPCNGPYRANYPVPDGVFDSNKLFNMDVADNGGPTSSEWTPIWETPKSLEVGTYSYYCRLHPWMRGAFEVVPA